MNNSNKKIELLSLSSFVNSQCTVWVSLIYLYNGLWWDYGNNTIGLVLMFVVSCHSRSQAPDTDWLLFC